MTSIRSRSIPARALWAAALALLIALRLLSPPGFMPSFERGAITITACPDADPVSGAAADHHHTGHSKSLHQPCAYASASVPSLGAAIGDPPTPIPAAAAPVIISRLAYLGTARTRDRPPLRGPPIPA